METKTEYPYNMTTEEFFKEYKECSKCGEITCCKRMDGDCCDCKITKWDVEHNSLFQQEVKRQLKLRDTKNNG